MVQMPEDAQIIDVAGKVIMPGLVDTHSHIGNIGGGDGSGPIQPDVRIYDSINVRDSGFMRARAGGLTTLNIMPGSGHLMSGQTVYVKIRHAASIEDMFILDEQGQPSGGMKMANGTNPRGEPPFPGTRGKAAALVRQQFIRAQEYQRKRQRAPADAAPVQPDDDNQEDAVADAKDKAAARDIGLEAMVEVLEGKRIVHHHTHRADDIMTVLRLQKEFGFRVVLHHVSEAWKVADEIAAANVPCSMIIVDSPGGKLEAAELTFNTAPILEKAGVLTAFHTDDWITDSRLWFRMAALGVRAGMSPKAALEALTINGAKMLDLDKRIGSLDVGKDADFIVLSGDPLSVYTHVEQTWIEGEKVFDRSNEKDRLYATGGFGAGHDQQPYFCCFDHAHAAGVEGGN
jgi:imidazolonepropionase-like amidohydrolase